jgi:hydrogenase small subunit
MKEQSLTRSISEEKLKGVSRRDFMKFCSIMAATMGLPASFAPKIAEAATTTKRRPPVIWLHGQECTGCTEALLRATHPTLEHLILDLISLDYHETLNVGAGHQAEAALHQSMKENAGKYILVVEGSAPVKEGGKYCMVGGRPFVDIVKETAAKAAAVVAIGSCASWGGVQSSPPNPTGATGIPEILKGTTVVTIPGCPPNANNFLATVLYFLTFGKLPALDEKARPKFAYGRLIHENCERRPHFDAGRFAETFGDAGHREGYCLYKLGCKGPITHANCPSILFYAGSGSWPVGTGHPCFGCTEQAVGFKVPLHTQAEVSHITPAAAHAPIETEQGKGVSAGAAAVVGGIAGVAIGAGAVIAKKLGESEEGE